MATRRSLWQPGPNALVAAPACGSDGAQLVGLWAPSVSAHVGQAPALPGGWRAYTSPTGRYSFGVPGSWSVIEGDEHSTCLRSRAALAHLFLMVKPIAGGHGLFDEALGLDALADSICSHMDPMQTFEVRHTGLWSDGSRHGYVVEGSIHDDLLGMDIPRAYVVLPVSESEVLLVIYSVLDGSAIADEQRGVIHSIVRSFCLNSWGTPPSLGQYSSPD